MKKLTGTRLLTVILTVIVIGYFSLQIFQYYRDPLTTTPAYAFQVEKSAELSGYVVRTEQVLPSEEGLLRLDRAEGERISNGGVVATVYADQASLDSQAEVEKLSNKLEQLKFAQESMRNAEVSLKLDSEISEEILKYRGALAADHLTAAEDHGEDLRALILKRDYTYSGSEDLETKIEDMQAQLESARARAAASVRTVRSPQAGLYSAVVDGLETVLTPEGLADMTPKQLTEIEADAAVTSNVGKLILGDKWYYAALMRVEDALALKRFAADGGELLLRFSKGVERELSVRLYSVSAEENGQMAVVFSGDSYLQELTLLRHQSAEVIFGSISGIRVPAEALRVTEKVQTDEGGEEKTVSSTGVYCVVGTKARLKPVKILYSEGSFALVQAATSDEKLRLRPDDQVIVRASGLFDGKVVGEELS